MSAEDSDLKQTERLTPPATIAPPSLPLPVRIHSDPFDKSPSKSDVTGGAIGINADSAPDTNDGEAAKKQTPGGSWNSTGSYNRPKSDVSTAGPKPYSPLRLRGRQRSSLALRREYNQYAKPGSSLTRQDRFVARQSSVPKSETAGTFLSNLCMTPIVSTQPALVSYHAVQPDSRGSALSPASQSLSSTILNHREGYGTQSHPAQGVNPCMDKQETGKFWQDKYQALMIENDTLHKMIETWKSEARAEGKRADAEAAKCQREKEMLEKLRLSHIRAVNSTGTGLDPIADQTFVEKYPMLHRDVYYWCRKGFVRGEYESQSEVRLRDSAEDLLRTRVKDIGLLKFPRLLECLSWAFIEERVFSIWLPGLQPRQLESILALEAYIARVDHTPDGEKTSLWRAQTASLLFQDQQFKDSLADVSELSSELIAVLRSVEQRPVLQERYLTYIDATLRSLNTLAAEMKCQRGKFELDTSVVVGALYDGDTMEDVDFTDLEEGMQAFVVAVLSRGWIRTPPREVGATTRHINKSRVLVKVVPDLSESQSDG